MVQIIKLFLIAMCACLLLIQAGSSVLPTPVMAAAGLEAAAGSAVPAAQDATPGELASWMAAKILLLDVAFYTIALPVMIR